eukprot:TRINITY_DN77_c0_g1_i4.p2 TRINITY_DN77_c0_g1~~TRINITY_DN77_c0_g1_i4.p2  ORF type:complete len:289 (+),score=95.19 TRINITY_DN77_c0_g1_i4:2400-3266(+)
MIKMRVPPKPRQWGCGGRPFGRGRGKWRRFARGGRGCFYNRARQHQQQQQQQQRERENTTEATPRALNNKARFIKDVSVFDGTEVQPGTRFTKIWRFRNEGDDAWLPGTKLAYVGGDTMGHPTDATVDVPVVAPGDDIEISVDLIAPELPGRYTSYWRLLNPKPYSTRFGHRVWADILVVEPEQAKRPPSEYELVDVPKSNASAAPSTASSASASNAAPASAPTSNVSEPMDVSGDAPTSAPQVEDAVYAQHLATLREMGFENDYENKRLLRHHEGNLARVVQDIMNL